MLTMNIKIMLTSASIAVVLAVLAAGTAISAQDEYTLKVPDGLAFSELRGFEDWQTVAVSQSGEIIAVILANPVMIEAYRAGVSARRVR
jgi:hypothetical protein